MSWPGCVLYAVMQSDLQAMLVVGGTMIYALQHRLQCTTHRHTAALDRKLQRAVCLPLQRRSALTLMR